MMGSQNLQDKRKTTHAGTVQVFGQTAAGVFWSPINKSEIALLESIQKGFILKIQGINKDCSKARQELNLYYWKPNLPIVTF